MVDVAGSTGVIAKAIVGAFPHVKCSVLDLPHVIVEAPTDGEVRFVAGDMFEHIPPADVVLLKVIDLAVKLVNPIVEPGEVFPNINDIHLVIASELLDHRVVGVESTLHHPLALEDLLLHCFEPRLHASDLLRPLDITDVQHPSPILID
ncbi:O-methyltransferase ZRP4 [Hordeum vulgare]|nr:O-methyltransferase ZRP4 [Hordeum vulgare]